MVILLNLTSNRACYDRYDYRIKYLNLKNTRSQNSLALEDVQRLWIPFLVFDNTEKNEATKVQSNCPNRQFSVPKKKMIGNQSDQVTSSFIELFVQGTEDTELTLTREGNYVGSTDDFAEVSTIK